MGLDTTHDCWRGSYSRFNRFILCKNGAKLNKRLNDLLNTLTENLKNGEILNLN